MKGTAKMRKILAALIAMIPAAALAITLAAPASAAHVIARQDCHEYTPTVNNTMDPNSTTAYWNCNDDPAQGLQIRAWCHPSTGSNYFTYSAKVYDLNDPVTAVCNSGDVIKGAASRIQISGTWGSWLNYWSA